MRIPLFTWVFVVILLGILVRDDVGSVSGHCQRDQQYLLLQFNESLIFDKNASTKLVSWNTSIDCCRWDGVTCDEGGRVVGLNLSNESITGGLENLTGLFGLQFLQNLDLSFNNFNTTLPARFADLSNLMSLNLSNAGFIGQIPIQISFLTSLVSLDLSMLSYLGFPPLKLENPNLAKLVQNLTLLINLRLDGVNISARGNEWCQALSSSLPNLQVLSLSNCFLSGPVDPSLSQLQSLTVIQLSNNNLSAPVPKFFGNFSNLIALRLATCELSGKFPEQIFQVPALKMLDLSNNKFLQGNLPLSLQSTSLSTLALSNTKFSGALPGSIGNLGNLSRVELSGCNFSGPIPSSMANLTRLVYLDLSSNNFTGPIPSFSMSKNLTHIDFSHNQLMGEIPSTNLEGLQNLANVDLRQNLLSGSIPSSLFAIKSLQKIQLAFNQFDGQVPEFSNASSALLDTVDLSSNKLRGPIPSSVFYLGRLRVLLLSSNKFNGTVKFDWIQKLGKLTTIDLSYNNLTVEASASNSTFLSFSKIISLKLASCNLGEFPDLSKHANLFHLDLSNNHISGVVPGWVQEVGNGSLQYLNLSHNLLVGLEQPSSIPSLISLSVLDLSCNQLQGNIPIPPQSATYVDYSDNKFTSSIPADIGNRIPFAFFLSLSNNSLIGVIPESICNATYLQVLDLSNNNLSGKIPACLMESIKSLAVLNLRRNRFHGNIPDQFPVSCELQTLDVSGNHLEGNIPTSLANCNALEVLDLGNNLISGGFPCHLKNVSSLRVLILRNNKFYGLVGCLKDNITWAKLQIVDIAANNYSGNLPEKWLATWAAMMGNGTDTYDHLRFKPLQLNSRIYYQDSITVTSKGFEMELVKILTVFTSIDFSNNKFEGPIPEVMGRFTALYGLNLSHNSFRGQIPSVLGNLLQLESLDLSYNQLSGAIPQQLARPTFLSVLNLSYNRLVGQIPKGNQLQTFDQYSYLGNKGLCGRPLNASCSDASTNSTPTHPVIQHQKSNFDWQFIVSGIGFGLGAGAAIAPLLFWKKVNKLYDDQIDKILIVILPMCGLWYYARDDWRIQLDENLEEDAADNDDDDEEKDEEEDDLGGRYCVYCTKLDITRKRAIHDPKCTCYHSPPLSSTSSSCSSSSSYSS